MNNTTGPRLRRSLLLAGIVGTAALLASAPAMAAAGGTGHTVTLTQVTHGIFDPGLTGANPCTGADVVSETGTGTVVNHETYFPAGDEAWGTFTETGQVTVVDSSNTTYTGHLTMWGNFNMNQQNANNTFTMSVNLTGSDGSSITLHEVQHFALNANGVVTVSFDRPTLTCG
jgi:hypothetical protein